MGLIKLLLVDDEEDFVTTLAQRLNMRNYHTMIATSGKDALAEIQKERPDIVLLDLKMPVMDGLEVLARIKAADPSIKVIMLTGQGDVKSGEKAKKAGALGYLVKPFDIDILLSTLKDLDQK